ncbi:MAG: DedA family protein [Succinivibrionaceae bacterium]|nr:DedA family protein [Succinivibrionaceae bacterium]
MAEKFLQFVIDNLTDFGWYNYLFAFAILILCGFGLPIPEDITLVSGGLISGLKATNPHIMLVICFAGVLIGDSTMYILGKTFGYRIQNFRPMRKVLPPERFAKVQDQFTKYGIWVLFFARFMPGLRSPIFLAAGMSHRIPFSHFILMDGTAALISVPVWVYLGYYCADSLPKLLEYVKDGQSVVHVIIGIALALVLFIFLKGYIKKKIAQKAQKIAQGKEEAKESKNTNNESISAKTNENSNVLNETKVEDTASTKVSETTNEEVKK